MGDKHGQSFGRKDYEVGYGRPPKHSRFPKGRSGNPKGPRKGSRALKTDLDEALRATLTINVAGKKRRGTAQALSMYALAIKAATGDLRAAKLLADLVMTVFGPGDRGGTEAKLSKHDEELLDRLLERLEPDEAKEDEGTLAPELDPDENPAEADAGADHDA
jgi:hypothetical protein